MNRLPCLFFISGHFLWFLENPDEDLHDLHLPCMNSYCFQISYEMARVLLGKFMHISYENSNAMQRACLGFDGETVSFWLGTLGISKLAPVRTWLGTYFKCHANYFFPSLIFMPWLQKSFFKFLQTSKNHNKLKNAPNDLQFFALWSSFCLLFCDY